MSIVSGKRRRKEERERGRGGGERDKQRIKFNLGPLFKKPAKSAKILGKKHEAYKCAFLETI